MGFEVFFEVEGSGCRMIGKRRNNGVSVEVRRRRKTSLRWNQSQTPSHSRLIP